MAAYTGDRYEPLTKIQLATRLGKLGEVEMLKKKIQKDLEEREMRLGMAFWIEFFTKSSKHPYPHIQLSLVDKGTMPFKVTRIRYNAVGTPISEEEMTV